LRWPSNVFAILGLRALYFALAGVIGLFCYLHYGLSALLVFVGAKMLLADIYTRKLGGLAALLLFLGGLLGEASAEVNGVRGQTLYVPVYSEIPYGARDHTLALTATLSIRNIDRKVPMTVRKVDYYNAQGELVRSYTQEPQVLSPLAAVEFVLKQSDRSGGISAGFIVVWESERGLWKRRGSVAAGLTKRSQ